MLFKMDILVLRIDNIVYGCIQIFNSVHYIFRKNKVKEEKKRSLRRKRIKKVKVMTVGKKLTWRETIKEKTPD